MQPVAKLWTAGKDHSVSFQELRYRLHAWCIMLHLLHCINASMQGAMHTHPVSDASLVTSHTRLPDNVCQCTTSDANSVRLHPEFHFKTSSVVWNSASRPATCPSDLGRQGFEVTNQLQSCFVSCYSISPQIKS